ncbi:MAG: UDP-glucose/iron transport system ATP-binding protein [Clostridiales bacterium]|nr:UDP-glucose/iron transport system ATP-binding protein [Clostridiales bacterium]
MFSFKDVTYKNILSISSLTIPENKITCIVGESGSGKTTLLKLLNKLISCDHGSILYQGQPLQKVDTILLRREVVMLPQIPVMFPGNVRDNLLIGLYFSQKAAVTDQELIKIMNFIQLDKPLDAPCTSLSGGEKQRLALGRVLLLRPKVFLLDEPSSALDEDTEQVIIEKLMRYVKERNSTLVMITHAKKIANHYAEYKIELRQGSILSEEVCI